MTRVLLATCAQFPAGEPFGETSILAALAARGVEARWVPWDDPDTDWSAADAVVVRSTWDYTARRAAFLAWAASVPTLLPGADVLTWNTDKRYLLDLAAAGLPVVPTVVADTRDELVAALAGHDEAVVKPTVGASGAGVVVVRGAAEVAGGGPWLVQPLVGSVRTTGETSVWVLGGRVVGQVRKRPAPDGTAVLVHEEHGGRTDVVPVGEEHAALALRAVAVGEALLGTRLAVARVDQMVLDDETLAVGELEVTEPGLYLDLLPGNAEAFAAAVAGAVDVRG